MKKCLIGAACLLLCLLSGAQTPDSPSAVPLPDPVPVGMPMVFDISSGVTTHVQGIAVNR